LSLETSFFLEASADLGFSCATTSFGLDDDWAWILPGCCTMSFESSFVLASTGAGVGAGVDTVGTLNVWVLLTGSGTGIGVGWLWPLG